MTQQEREQGFRSILEDNSLSGWKQYPRLMYNPPKENNPHYDAINELNEKAKEHLGIWTIENGVLEGRQDTYGFGCYLVSEETFGDFELRYEAKPDWPADTGIYVRTNDEGYIGYQILLDYRKSGSIGGFYGNGIGGFHAVNWNLDGVFDENGKLIGIQEDDPAKTNEPVTQEKIDFLSYGISVEDFLKVWKFDDWNDFSVTCVGRIPKITTCINGVKIAEIDMAEIDSPKFNRAAAEALGDKGHISIEVHDNDAALGEGRWGRGCACRWRNIRIKEL